MRRVYVLNTSYECISTCSLSRALSLVSEERAEVVKYSENIIRTISRSIQIPLIIKIFKYIRVYCRRLKYSNKMVWERDNFICQYCGEHIEDKSKLTADHVIPKSRGGKTIFENMTTACSHCNKKKNNRTPQESGMFPLKTPTKPTMTRRMKEVVDEVKNILIKNIKNS